MVGWAESGPEGRAAGGGTAGAPGPGTQAPFNCTHRNPWHSTHPVCHPPARPTSQSQPSTFSVACRPSHVLTGWKSTSAQRGKVGRRGRERREGQAAQACGSERQERSGQVLHAKPTSACLVPHLHPPSALCPPPLQSCRQPGGGRGRRARAGMGGRRPFNRSAGRPCMRWQPGIQNPSDPQPQPCPLASASMPLRCALRSRYRS